jgi:hypothetical protein
VFGTYQPEVGSVPVVYGITRAMKRHSFLDAYFGEFSALARDVYRAPGLKNKLLYIVMPPGWNHAGDHKTATVIRRSAVQPPDEQKTGAATIAVEA